MDLLALSSLETSIVFWPVPPIPPLLQPNFGIIPPYVFDIIALGTIARIYFFAKYTLKFIHLHTRKRNFTAKYSLNEKGLIDIIAVDVGTSKFSSQILRWWADNPHDC